MPTITKHLGEGKERKTNEKYKNVIFSYLSLITTKFEKQLEFFF